MFEGEYTRNISTTPTAVELRGVRKSFRKAENVLNSVNLTVEQGTVYGLLGASGCGKTTLLSCILSIQKFDSGILRVFGKNPGTKDCGIPGSLIGYMPQETALYYLFSIYEALWYYGKLYGMNNKEINDRIIFLKSFLKLPKLSRIIDTLSGGQTRRVSLALALIHKPKLLILDEPSVGLNPVLREIIWNHLSEIVTKENVTVMVTTHYITEAVHCDKIGIMRNGKLIAEDSPKRLMELHSNKIQSDSKNILLDEVVTFLCRGDELEKQNFSQDKRNHGDIFRRKSSKEIESIPASPVFEPKSKCPSFLNMLFALGYKNLLIFRRDWMLLTIILTLCPFNTMIFETVLGSTPKGLVLNYFVGNESKITENYCKHINYTASCFSDDRFPICNFLRRLEQRGLKLVQAPNEMASISNIENGDVIGSIGFHREYADHLKKRMLFRNFVDNETVFGAEIKIKLDMSAVIKTAFLRESILKEYTNSMEDIVKGCGENAKLVELPLKFESLQGVSNKEDDYINFFRPGFVVIMIYTLGTFTGPIYVREKRIGVLNRGFVVGVKFWQQVISSLITDSFLFIYHIVTMFTIQSQIFEAEFKGSMTLCALFCYLIYIYGIVFSIFISFFLKDELQIILIILILNSCQIFSTGAFWPLECISWPLRWMCYAFPITIPLDAFRSVMFYGWGLSHPRILAGFGSSLVWIFLTSLAIIFMQKKSN